MGPQIISVLRDHIKLVNAEIEGATRRVRKDAERLYRCAGVITPASELRYQLADAKTQAIGILIRLRYFARVPWELAQELQVATRLRFTR